MDHFYQNIHGFFDFQNVYTRMVNEYGDGAHFVEVGAFYGRSTAYMAVELINSKKAINNKIANHFQTLPCVAGVSAVFAGCLGLAVIILSNRFL